MNHFQALLVWYLANHVRHRYKCLRARAMTQSGDEFHSVTSLVRHRVSNWSALCVTAQKCTAHLWTKECHKKFIFLPGWRPHVMIEVKSNLSRCRKQIRFAFRIISESTKNNFCTHRNCLHRRCQDNQTGHHIVYLWICMCRHRI